MILLNLKNENMVQMKVLGLNGVYNSMKQNPWEASSHSVSQEMPCLLWNLKVHYHVHKSLSFVSILSQMHPVQTFPPYSLKSILISSHSCLVLQSGLFPSGFLTKILGSIIQCSWWWKNWQTLASGKVGSKLDWYGSKWNLNNFCVYPNIKVNQNELNSIEDETCS